MPYSSPWRCLGELRKHICEQKGEEVVRYLSFTCGETALELEY